MGDFAELEGRIRAALERIDAGIERLGSPAVPDLQAELDAERAARAEAEAALNDLQSPMPSAETDRLLAQIDAQSLDNQRLRATVSSLREEVRRLSEALAEGLADASLINHALATEVEALRAQRASETLEMGDILAELDRLVATEELAHA